LEGEVAGTDKKSKDSKKKQEAARRTKSVALPEMPSNLTIAWVGDSTNILHDMLVSYPRMGHSVRVSTPSGAAYQCPTPVWDKVVELGCDKRITWTTDPREAVNGADIIVTDTWLVMLHT
jgi:ornithine carbamoyltransferase